MLEIGSESRDCNPSTATGNSFSSTSRCFTLLLFRYNNVGFVSGSAPSVVGMESKTGIRLLSVFGLVLALYALYVEAKSASDPHFVSLCDINAYISCTKVSLRFADHYEASRLMFVIMTCSSWSLPGVQQQVWAHSVPRSAQRVLRYGWQNAALAACVVICIGLSCDPCLRDVQCVVFCSALIQVVRYVAVPINCEFTPVVRDCLPQAPCSISRCS